MIIRLLCPGPSLADYAESDLAPAALTVGVNTAATRFVCDVWAAGDSPLIERICGEVLGRPMLLTSTETERTLRLHAQNKVGPGLWAGQWECWTSVLDWCPIAFRWNVFSATAALVWCGFKGAKRINVYGADMAGTKYFDGREGGTNTRPQRWELERITWKNLVEFLLTRGAEVVRHGRSEKAAGTTAAAPAGETSIRL